MPKATPKNDTVSKKKAVTPKKKSTTKTNDQDVLVSKAKPKNQSTKIVYHVFWVHYIIEHDGKDELVRFKLQIKKNVNSVDAIDLAQKKMDKKMAMHKPYTPRSICITRMN